MTNLQRKVMTALTAGSVLVYSVAPVFGSTSLIISGNGSDSNNETQVQMTSQTTVVQNNNTSVKNDVDVESNTGDNKANDNTGGDVLIETGDSDVKVEVGNQLNSNVADVESCDCETDTEVIIQGNGTGSDNDAALAQLSGTQVFQTNTARVDNDVDVDANTGKNEAEDNTGGSVVIDTGDSDVVVKTYTMANANSARIMGEGDGSSVKLWIAENGSDSDNDIELLLERYALITQENLTSIENDIDVDSNTGKNDIDDSTGGIVAVLTGDSDIEAWVENMAGFNAADLGCDCMLEDILAKIWGNGTDTENRIAAKLDAVRDVFQDNVCGYGYMPKPGEYSLFGSNHHRGAPCFDNDLDLEGQTGENELEDNTGSVEYGDPVVDTGDSDVTVKVENAGGSNTFGSFELPEEWEWPDLSGMSLSISFDMSDLLAYLMDHMS